MRRRGCGSPPRAPRRGCGSPPRAPRLGRASLPGAPLLGRGSAASRPHPAPGRAPALLLVARAQLLQSGARRARFGLPAWSGRGLEELRTLRTTTRGTGRAALPRGRADMRRRPVPAAPRLCPSRRPRRAAPVRNSSSPVRVAPDSGLLARPGRGLEELHTLRAMTRGTGRGPATGRADARCHPLHRPRPWLCPSMPVRNSSSRCSWRLIRASWPGLSAEWRSCARFPVRTHRPRPPPTGGVSRIAGSR